MTPLALFSACGGSKSNQQQTTPVTATAPPEEPSSLSTESIPGEATPPPIESGQPGDLDRQPVSGTEPQPIPGMEKQPVSGTEKDLTTTGLAAPGIFAMLSTASEGEIAASQLVVEKTKNKDVKQFAQMMIEDHRAMMSSNDQKARDLGITPAPNDRVTAMKGESTTSLDRLRGLSGKELDRAYIDLMVQDHQKLLGMIDSELKPAAASNTDVGKMLDNARMKVEHHLSQAQKVQTKL